MSDPHPFHDLVERRIRDAIEAGSFDGLPGSGRPLPETDASDPDWWVKRKVASEGLGTEAFLPGVLHLRREAASYPDSLAEVPTETAVRQILTDYNRRVREDRLRPSSRPLPIVAPLLDVEALVAQWWELRR